MAVQVEAESLGELVTACRIEAAPQVSEAGGKLHSGKAVGQPQLAGHIGEPAPHRHSVAGRIEAEGADPTGGWPQQPSRQRIVVLLPEPLGTEKAEDLASGDLQIDPANGLDFAVVLHKAVDLDDRIRGAHDASASVAMRLASNDCSASRAGAR